MTVVWRFQSSRYPLVNSEGAKLTGGRWNRVHHGGIPEDYVGGRLEIPDDVEIAIAEVADGWPDRVAEAVSAEQGTRWVNECARAVLRVPSATMSGSGFNYVLNPAHAEFARISFSFEAIRFDDRLRGMRAGRFAT